MSVFFYRAKGFPGAIPSREWLIERGLFDVLGRGFRAVQCPREGDALLCSRDTTMHEVTAALSELGDDAWQPWGAAGDIRFAWFKDERRPSPERLARHREETFRWQTSGAVLGDFNFWNIPVLKSGVAERVVLPLVMRWNAADGEWCESVATRYARLTSIADRCFAGMLRDIGIRVEAESLPLADDQATLAREALGMLYRVGPQEISALELLTDANLGVVLAIALNAETVAAEIVTLAEAETRVRAETENAL